MATRSRPSAKRRASGKLRLLLVEIRVCFRLVQLDVLIVERLWLLVLENLLGVRGKRLTLVAVGPRLDRQPELQGAVTPIEDMCLLGGIVPGPD